MKDTMGIILADDNHISLNELTKTRSVSAMPYGGRYRLIDFVLSNMVNSGITNVGVTTLYKYSSLMDHIGTGKPWDLNRKKDGIFILPPFIRENDSNTLLGNVDVLHGILTFLRRSSQAYVVLSYANKICNMKFNDALLFHKERDADITIIYNNENKTKDELSLTDNILTVDEDGMVKTYEVKPYEPKSTYASMGMFILKREMLIRLIEEAYSKNLHDFNKDIIIPSLKEYRVYGYEYKGYLGRIDSVKSYYQHNMDLLNEEIRNDLFDRDDLIYTKVKDQVPTKYKNNAKVQDSLIADGCIIDGTVINSIIFRAVIIGKGTVVKNSIIMQNSHIDSNCELEHVIIDKESTISSGKRLVGQKNFPVIIPKRTFV